MKFACLKPILAIALCAMMVMLPVTAKSATNPITSTVTGTIANGGGTFAGTFRLINFSVTNGQVVANGLLSGTLTDALGNVIGTLTNTPVALPVAASGTCQILTLTVGPLNLNLLGLMVHLNQVVLTITAQQAPGNLLGNLLCSVAHLLDSNGTATALAQLLNRILGVVGAL